MKPIDTMHLYFGKDHVHWCGECCNLILPKKNGTGCQCARYGTGSRQPADWRKGWAACGAFDQPLRTDEAPLMKRLPGSADPTEQIEGQTSLFCDGSGP